MSHGSPRCPRPLAEALSGQLFLHKTHLAVWSGTLQSRGSGCVVVGAGLRAVAAPERAAARGRPLSGSAVRAAGLVHVSTAPAPHDGTKSVVCSGSGSGSHSRWLACSASALSSDSVRRRRCH
eukprot:1493950-Prymnesium_polylepis.1